MKDIDKARVMRCLTILVLLLGAAAAQVGVRPYIRWPGEIQRSQTVIVPKNNRSALNIANNTAPSAMMLVTSAPTNLAVGSSSAASVGLNWSPSTGADHYILERGQSLNGPFTAVGSSTGASYADSSVTSGQAYLYRVKAVDSYGAVSTPSSLVFATAITFLDEPLATGVTAKAQHLSELRQAVNAVRAIAGLPPASWTDGSLAGMSIKASHIQELRDRLGEALSALNIPAPSYTDSSLSAGITTIKKAHIQELRLNSTRGSSTSTGPFVDSGDLARELLNPANRVGGGGEDPFSRNYNWGISLVSLPGRAGLNLGISLSYNSLVWTKSGNYISFNDDYGAPSPGFRLGFPVIQSAYYNSETTKNAFLLILPDGNRRELRQVGSSALYESVDSSYLLLDSSTMRLRTTDGTQLSYTWQGADYQCTEIKDRNGNFITINYNAAGRISSIVDTLSRTINFNYDANGYLTSITQSWAGGTHNWARFSYADVTIQTNFSGLTTLGPPNGTTIKLLSQVKLADDAHFDFDYTTWGQIWKIRNHAKDNHLLNYRSYNLPLDNTAAQTDCPRFTQRRDWAENWNRNGSLGTAGLPTGNAQEAVTTYASTEGASWTLPNNTQQSGTTVLVTMPDGATSHKIYFPGVANTSTGWHRGMPSMVETYAGGNLQRQSVTTWTQDDTNVSYLLNPRVTETNIHDPSGNHSRTSVSYQSVNLPDGTTCKLPQDVREYHADATTVLRRSHTEYELSATYTSRRIIGLVSEKTLYEGEAGSLKSKVSIEYDGTGSILGSAAPVQHDNTNYGASFVAGRGNVSTVTRHNVHNSSPFTASTVKYNTAGAPVASIDPLNHQVTISYADSFSDGNNSRNTLAYPTTITDPDNYSSSSQYNFDFGAVTRMQTPPPEGQTVGAIKRNVFDAIGRLQKVAVEFNGNPDYSYTRVVYADAGNRVDTYATIKDSVTEAHSLQISDGHGRVFASATDHPGSAGGFSGQLVLFDVMGRAIKSSNPTETSASGEPSSWVAAGDDAAVGWVYRQQSYDWKGRPLISTNPDGTTKEASYGGCGCAGGEVVTLTDEGTVVNGVTKKRQQKVYADVLGRTVKTEVLNWDGAGPYGTGGSVYSSVVNVYNVLDQVETVKQYAGAATTDGSCPTGTCQQTTMTYDGFGRLKMKHVPEQDAGAATTYNYNTDDTVSSTVDARGATRTFAYNARHQVTGISYSAPSGITIPASVTFGYDAAGNRISMTDGIGSASYVYNQLSRMTSETRTFTGLTNSLTISYSYNPAGELTSFTDPFGAVVNYGYDATGRLSAVTGSNFANLTTYASDAQYRAWGALKSLSYGNTKTLAAGYNNNLQTTTYEVPGVLKKSYEYNTDGRLKFTHDDLTTNSKFDRSYEYDHMGRVTKALTGAEARGGAATNDRPYNETLVYDAMNHLTTLNRLNWDRDDSMMPHTITNTRVPFPFATYDADGRILTGDTPTRMTPLAAPSHSATKTPTRRNSTSRVTASERRPSRYVTMNNWRGL